MAAYTLGAQTSVTPSPTNPLNWRPGIFTAGTSTVVHNWTLDSFWRSTCGIKAIASILNANFLEKAFDADGTPLHDNLASDLHLAMIELADGISTQLVIMSEHETGEAIREGCHE